MIEFKNVSKVYPGNITAIDDISLTVENGEFVVLLGPSGCGKTTLLRMVNQLEDISGGEIKVEGKSIHELNKIEMRRNIGYVIQNNGLFPNMTIEDNTMIVPNLLGWDRVKKKKRFNYLMDLVGMEPDKFRKRYPHELSGGQQQRIGVIRALAADPPVMLMDEPFGALDPIIRNRVQDEFLEIQKQVQKTILFVSHDIDEAVKMGDKIALLRAGEIMQFDTPSTILHHPYNQFVSDFVGKDRVLKSMSLYTVEDLIENIKLQYVDQPSDSTIYVDKDTSLRNVLSDLFNQKSNEVIAVDENNNNIGKITLSVIESFLETESYHV